MSKLLFYWIILLLLAFRTVGIFGIKVLILEAGIKDADAVDYSMANALNTTEIKSCILIGEAHINQICNSLLVLAIFVHHSLNIQKHASAAEVQSGGDIQIEESSEPSMVTVRTSPKLPDVPPPAAAERASVDAVESIVLALWLPIWYSLLTKPVKSRILCLD